MPKEGHTEEQIVVVLQQGESGEKVEEVCRRIGISQATYYSWKTHYAGLGIHGSARAGAIAGGECSAQAADRRSVAGPADSAGDCVKNVWCPVERFLATMRIRTYPAPCVNNR